MRKEGREKKNYKKAITRQDKTTSFRNMSDFVGDDIDLNQVKSRLRIGKVRKVVYT